MVIQISDRESAHFEKILDYYSVFKRLTLHFEERYDKTFPPAALGIRDTLDHMMRSLSVMFSKNDFVTIDESEEYILSNLIAAENHLYRAIFEMLDIMTAISRNRIIEILSEYSNETINVILPIYYREIREFLIKMDSKVERYRVMKDSSKIRMDDVDAYLEEVERLERYASEIEGSIPQMNEYEASSRIRLKEDLSSIKSELDRSRILNYILGVISITSFVITVYAVV